VSASKPFTAAAGAAWAFCELASVARAERTVAPRPRPTKKSEGFEFGFLMVTRSVAPGTAFGVAHVSCH
jgi:hypothetical protein